VIPEAVFFQKKRHVVYTCNNYSSAKTLAIPLQQYIEGKKGLGTVTRNKHFEATNLFMGPNQKGFC
jgi:hypothetical protein